MQLDVLAIEQWSENNHLTLNSAKCKAMVISRKKNPYSQPLYLNGVVLDQVESFKYLGVNISHDLTWSNHIGKISGKARQTLGQFYGKCDSGSLLKLYISLVRPHLEYACPVWAPHDIHLIERVQMFGVKIISGEWNAAYHDCLDQFSLVTLERRRLDLSLCLLYKYVNSMCYFPEGLISKRCNSSYNIRVHCCSNNHLLELTLIFIHSFLTLSLSGTLYCSCALIKLFFLLYNNYRHKHKIAKC